jgi:dolichyl-diphosphooligosaccharide---protein glycosyltransferase
MKNSLMYRLCYYRFGEVRTRGDQPTGFDTVRNAEIGLKKYDLHYFREAYSSSRWLVRIYEVLPLPNRAEKYVKKVLSTEQKKALPAAPTLATP